MFFLFFLILWVLLKKSSPTVAKTHLKVWQEISHLGQQHQLKSLGWSRQRYKDCGDLRSGIPPNDESEDLVWKDEGMEEKQTHYKRV